MAVKPVALIADGRQIARFGAGTYEFPWFTAPLLDLSQKHRAWLSDVTQFRADMDAADNDEMDDAAADALWFRRLAELGLKNGDLDIFNALSVAFTDGSVHRIGPAYYEDGDLRWRNGEDLTGGEQAEFKRPVTHRRAFFELCKGIAEQVIIHVIGLALIIAGLAAWAAGWFG